MKNLNVNMVTEIEVKGRKVRFEDKEVGLKIYTNKGGNLKVQLNGLELTDPNESTEFAGCTVYPSGLVLKSIAGKKMIFKIEEECWFKAPNGEFEFQKAFLLGGILASIHGEPIKEYKMWKLPSFAA
ncbi:MAG: hypothetical protein PF542_05560 [Nanoarchaeota archaeon]|jgi:hypothetical protein|nr:hypothetical protein [Nanoarchaeota archaeon]